VKCIVQLGTLCTLGLGALGTLGFGALRILGLGAIGTRVDKPTPVQQGGVGQGQARQMKSNREN
jgi:hypothetical protein